MKYTLWRLLGWNCYRFRNRTVWYKLRGRAVFPRWVREWVSHGGTDGVPETMTFYIYKDTP